MIYLHSIGHYHPENRVTNSFLSSLDIGCDKDWIIDRLGIEERRTLLDLDYIRHTKNLDLRAAPEASALTQSQLGAHAARVAIERAAIDASEIAMVICGSSVPSYLSPAGACCVAAELDLSVPCFDISSACSSFGAGIFMLSGMRPESLPGYILLLSIDTITQTLDYTDRNSVSIFGDGAAAALLSLTNSSGAIIQDCRLDSNPLAWDKVTIPRVKHFSQDGNAVQGFAIRKATEGLKRLKSGLTASECSRLKFIGHQANLGMLRKVAERCEILPENHLYNVVDYGNTGCASAPSVLSQQWHSISPGDLLGMALVGAGLSWASLMIRFSDTMIR